jgi:hypothetical protein
MQVATGVTAQADSCLGYACRARPDVYSRLCKNRDLPFIFSENNMTHTHRRDDGIVSQFKCTGLALHTAALIYAEGFISVVITCDRTERFWTCALFA